MPQSERFIVERATVNKCRSDIADPGETVGPAIKSRSRRVDRPWEPRP
jgi:hypothetical protein